GGAPTMTASMEALADFIKENSLLDMDLHGSSFTWSNRRLGRNHIQSRLDRSLGSLDWISLFPDFYLKSLPRAASDHSPLLLSANHNLNTKNPPF
ncbi:hypothetical protein KI387_029322, partial [Taxus chinensis]